MTLKILCAIDDEEHSWRAASVGIDLAKRLSAELMLCMINPVVLPGRGPIVYRWTESYLDQVLNEVVRRARRLGLWDVRRKTGRAIFVADGIVAEREIDRRSCRCLAGQFREKSRQKRTVLY